jgi:predicted HTH transcriptional regulator
MLRSIRHGAKIKGLYRKDRYELPPSALREAIVNAIAHRDYRQHAYVQVSVAPGYVEIVSPGSLFDGLTKDEMLSGKSKLRNPILADIFHKMGMIEKWGTGLPRIFVRCAEFGVPAPQISIGGSTVSITFKRSREEDVQEGATIVGNVGNTVGNVGNTVGNVIEKDLDLNRIIMQCLRDDKTMSAAKIAKVARVTKRTIERALMRLKTSGSIKRVGGTRGVWEVVV